jgi:hypothetical protein
MGLEARCAATLDGQTSRGKALLETAELLFRGDFRVRVPLSEIKTVIVTGVTLTVKWRGGTLTLDLGRAAAKWAEKIKNPPSRLDKLGIKPDARTRTRTGTAKGTAPRTRVALVGDFDFDPSFRSSISDRGSIISSSATADILFYAPTSPADLELKRIAALAKRLAAAGALWIVRPKGKDTPITETDTRQAGLAAGLVDVKVAAFSPTHTALKFVRRLRDRG